MSQTKSTVYIPIVFFLHQWICHIICSRVTIFSKQSSSSKHLQCASFSAEAALSPVSPVRFLPHKHSRPPMKQLCMWVCVNMDVLNSHCTCLRVSHTHGLGGGSSNWGLVQQQRWSVSSGVHDCDGKQMFCLVLVNVSRPWNHSLDLPCTNRPNWLF